MRIDKYLKISRLIKRRTVAKEACDKGRITVNGRVAKAGTDVKIGDAIVITFGSSELEIKVTDLSEKVRKDDASSLYDVIGRTSTNSQSKIFTE